MLRRMLEALGRGTKGDASFGIDETISDSVLLGFMFHRLAMALRGVVLAVRSRHLVCPVFVGRRVVVTNARYLRLSRGVSIGDYCRLDCLGRTGIVLGLGTTLRRGGADRGNQHYQGSRRRLHHRGQSGHQRGDVHRGQRSIPTSAPAAESSPKTTASTTPTRPFANRRLCAKGSPSGWARTLWCSTVAPSVTGP
jgi:hypothetical protein